MPKIPRHKVFISRHHKNDQIYKDMLVETLKDGLVDKSVDDDDIDDANIKIATIRQKIREDFIADSTVTIVLIGTETHARKHIDWEISYTLRENKKKSRAECWASSCRTIRITASAFGPNSSLRGCLPMPKGTTHTSESTIGRRMEICAMSSDGFTQRF